MDVNKKKQPEVLVFEDTVRRKTKRKPRSESNGQIINDYEQRKQSIEENGLDLRETMNEMRALAAKSLTHDKRTERDLLLSLGAKAPPRQVMPYTRYLNVLKKRQKKGLTKADTEEVSMLEPRKSRGRQVKTSGKGRWRDNVKSLEPVKTLNKKR